MIQLQSCWTMFWLVTPVLVKWSRKRGPMKHISFIPLLIQGGKMIAAFVCRSLSEAMPYFSLWKKKRQAWLTFGRLSHWGLITPERKLWFDQFGFSTSISRLHANVVRTVQFNTILNEPSVIIFRMGVNTCLPESVPRVTPHLETRITDTSFA